jgi:anti-sigma B factor antagonist
VSNHPGEARGVLPDVSLPTQRHAVPGSAVPASAAAAVRLPGDWQLVRASGELDLACVPRLRAVLATSGSRVVLDLRGVTFLDASGLGVLVTASYRARRAGGAVRLVGASSQVRRVVTITSLDGVLGLFDSMGDALVAEPA